MTQLKTGITILEIIVAVAVLLVLGDYLGYKAGHRRVATFAGIAALIAVVAFAVYAAIVLAVS